MTKILAYAGIALVYPFGLLVYGALRLHLAVMSGIDNIVDYVDGVFYRAIVRLQNIGR